MLPKHASTTLSRAVKQECQPYHQLCATFTEGWPAWHAAASKTQMMQTLQTVRRHLCSDSMLAKCTVWSSAHSQTGQRLRCSNLPDAGVCCTKPGDALVLPLLQRT